MGPSGWIPSPVLPPGGEGHWREEGSGPSAEAASGAHCGRRGPEPWEPSAGLHEVLAGGGGGGHASEGCQGPGPAKPEVPQDPDPRAHLSPKPASDPASDARGIASPRARPRPRPRGIPGPGLRACCLPAGPHPGGGLEKGRTLAPERREEPEQRQDTVGATPKRAPKVRAAVPVSLASLFQILVPVTGPVPSRVSPLHFCSLLPPSLPHI